MSFQYLILKTCILTGCSDHVIRDLEPFSCLIIHCTDSNHQKRGWLTFETSKAWLSHMQNAHGHAWECRAPSHDPIIFQQEIEFQEHAREEHDVPEAHIGTLSGAARRPIREKILKCPFGDDFSAPEKAESNTLFANEALHLHVAAHMKEIALLALQKLPSDDDEKLEDVGSDVPLEADGFAKLRGSMYSVLDDESLNFPDEVGDSVSNTLEDGINSSVDRLDLEDKDAAGMTKLHHAVLDNDVSLAKSIIEQGASLRSRAKYGKTALHFASLSRDKDVDMMELLLESEDQEILNVRDENGQTPLHYAAKSDFADGIELMVRKGAVPDVLDHYGFSSYLWAVVAGRFSATNVLLNLGVDVNSASADGRSALGWAARLGHSQIARLLISKGANVMYMTRDTCMVPLEDAAAAGDLATVELLLNIGADLHYRDLDGWSAIHWAAEEGHSDVVFLLLKAGIDVNAVSSYGTSVLHCAANGGNHVLVSNLLQRGADTRKSTCHGWTPLHHAAFMGHCQVFQCFMQAVPMSEATMIGASQDNHGWSVLHLAIHGRHLQIVGDLLGNSITSECRLQRDENGLTAEEWLDFELDGHSYKTVGDVAFGKSRCCRAVTGLRQAVYDDNFALTELLLEQGSHVNGMNSGQRTALYYAAKKGHIRILNMLLENGANPNILPKGRRTWEEFISDDSILQQLRKFGYAPRIPYAEEENGIRRLFRGQQGEAYTLDPPQLPPPLAPTSALRLSRPAQEAEDRPRSRVGKLFKRLRGERMSL